MNCYYYKTINTSNDPILKNVDLTIILMMENSERFNYDPFILNLSKKTIIQYNKGFKNCKKPDFITKSNEDINHAYYTCFNYVKNLNNVLILEEDAEVLYYTRSYYDIVDKYLSGDFAIFSFGNNGIFTKIDDNFYSSRYTCGAQAQVISKSKRQELIGKFIKKNFKGHIEPGYFVKSVVFKRPLIVQLFPETENRHNWGDEDTSIAERIINNLAIKLFKADKDLNSWEKLYFVSKLRGQIDTIIFMGIVILIVTYLICRKKSILK